MVSAMGTLVPTISSVPVEVMLFFSAGVPSNVAAVVDSEKVPFPVNARFCPETDAVPDILI